MRLGAVRLNVADLDREQAFYEQTIGLRRLDGDAGPCPLGVNGSALVELVRAPGAPARPPGTTGLFHLAILLPGREELARALDRVARSGWSLSGASDHLVSEALYLSDPEDNGIEIYRDRPRGDWPYSNGRLQMSTLPLDLPGLAADLKAADGGPTGMAADAQIGHVHLNVGDLDRAEAFYCGLLGFDVAVRGYPGALFVSTGGYHHHLGLNTWAGEGAAPPPAGALGLSRMELVVDRPQELDRIERRLADAGVELRRDADGVHVRDPFATGILLRTR